MYQPGRSFPTGDAELLPRILQWRVGFEDLRWDTGGMTPPADERPYKHICLNQVLGEQR